MLTSIDGVESESFLLYPVISATFVRIVFSVISSAKVSDTLHSIWTYKLSNSPVPEYASILEPSKYVVFAILPSS